MSPPFTGAAIPAAADFIAGTLTGGLAATVAVIAVSWFGLMMMAGRVSRRRGTQLILGCFIVFGAPLVATGIMKSFAPDDASPGALPGQPSLPWPAVAAPARAASSNPYDPYAGAALPPRR